MSTEVSSAATIEDNVVDFEQALSRAVEILSAARMPVVAGLGRATIEAQRAAVSLADAIGGCVDWTTSPSHAAATLALQNTGAVTATYGEVAQRADVVILWDVDPETCQFQLESLSSSSPWIASREARSLVVIGEVSESLADHADIVIATSSDSAYESLTVLRWLVAGHQLDAESVLDQTGVSLDEWQVLAEQMRQANYGVLVHGGHLAASRESLALVTHLMSDLTATTRWVAVPAGSPGNRTGAASVLTWQTGYPLGVCLAHGYPQYGPDEFTTAKLLARGETDAVLVVADDLESQLDADSLNHLNSIPTIALDWLITPTMQSATVVIPVAEPGADCAGTISRADGVFLPLRASRSSERPTCESVLKQIEQMIFT